MARSLLVVALLVALAVCPAVYATDFEEENDVIIMTDDNFEALIAENGPTFVEFYAPWCGYCKKLTPEFEAAAAELKTLDPPMRIAKLDAPDNARVRDQFKIYAYPKLMMVSSITQTDETTPQYTGARTKDALVQWALDNVGARPALTDAEGVEALVEENSVVVVGIFSDASADKRSAFKKAALGISKVEAAFVEGPEGISYLDGFAEGDVVVLKTVDGVTTPHKYEGSLDGRTELVAFVTDLYDIYEPENGVLVLTDENWETAMDEFRQILVEFYAPWCGHCKQLAPEYIKAAADLAKDGLAIAKVDATQEVDLKAVAEVKSYPTLIFFCEGRTFPFEGERNADSLAAFVRANTFTDAEVLDSAADVKQFVSDSDVAVVGVFDNLDGPEAVAFLRGTSCLQRDYAIAITTDAGAATELGASAPAVLVFKSYHGGSRDEYEGEMEPKGISAFVTDKVTMFPEEDHVLVLTDDTFDLALEEYGTLLAEFYAPWCGHCKKLAPAYAAAATALSGTDKPIRLAKIDATANTKLGLRFGVAGYPTLKLVRAGLEDGDAKDFDGDRNKDGIEKWIDKNLGCTATHLSSREEFNDLLSSSTIVAVGFYEDADSAEAKAFKAGVAGLKQVVAGYTELQELADEFSAQPGNIVVLKTTDDGASRNNYDGVPTDVKGIRAFVDQFIDPIPNDGGVLVLDDDNFALARETYPALLVEFYAPWCGHCKRLAPEYEAAAQTLKRNDPPLYIAKIDATANPKAAKEFEAYRYPTVLFLCGDSTDKVGERQQDGIVNYVISNSIRELPQLESLDDVRTLTAANDVVTIGYFADLDSAAAKTFRMAVTCMKTKVFAVTDNAEVAKHFKATPGSDTLIGYNSFHAEALLRSEGLGDTAAITAFIAEAEAKFPEDEGVLVLDEDNFEDALAEYGTLLVEFYAPWCGHCKKLAPEYVQAAAMLRQDAHPTYIGKVDATENSGLAALYGVKGYPTLKVIRYRNPAVLDFSGDRNADGIATFMRERIGARPRALAAKSEVDELVSSANFVVVGFFNDPKRVNAFNIATNGLKNAAAATTADEGAASSLGASMGEVVVFKTTTGEAERFTFDGDATNDEALRVWVNSLVDKYPREAGVLVLDADNYDAALEEFGPMVIEFYAPWCGHCKKLAPVYAEAAQELAALEPPLYLAKVDATSNSRFGVRSYPTLKFVCGPGREALYEGERTKEAIMAYAKSHSSAKVSELDSADSARAFIDTSGVAVVAFADGAASPAATVLQRAMACDPGFNLAVADGAVADALRVRHDALVVFKRDERGREKKTTFSGDLSDAAAVRDWVRSTAKPFPEEDGVIVLTEKNFDAAVAAHGSLLVEFYAPWCGHCKSLAPEYVKAAGELAADGYAIAKVDATVNQRLQNRFEVKGFPTLIMVRARGSVLEYEGDRKAPSIVEFVKSRTYSQARSLRGLDDVTAALESSPTAVLGFFEDANSPRAVAFRKAAAGHKGLVGGVVTDPEVAEAHGAAPDQVIVFKTTTEEAERNVFDGDMEDVEALSDFIVAHLDKFPTEEGVVVLDDDNFDAAIANWGSMLVEFYAPWCGHCKQLAPKYAAAAAEIAESDSNLAIAKVDATAAKKLGTKFGVSSFPTLKFVCGATHYAYEEGRETEDIVQYVLDNSYAAPEELETVEGAESFIASAGDAAAIGFFADDADASSLTFQRALACVKDVKVGITTNAAVMQKYGVTAPAVVVFRNFKGDSQAYSGDFEDRVAIADFVLEAARKYPEEDNVIVLDDSTFDDAMLDYGALMVEFFTPWCQHCKKLAPDYAQVAGILRGDDPPLRIAKVDASTSTEVASRFGVTSYPTLILARVVGEGILYEGDRSVDNIAAFVRARTGSKPFDLVEVEEAEELKESADIVALGVFHDTASAEAKAFRAAATGHKLVQAAYTSDPALAAVFGGSKVDAGAAWEDFVTVFKRDDNGDWHGVDYEGNQKTVTAVHSFIAGSIDKFPRSRGVLVVDDDNIDEALHAFGPMVVEFHAPWCNACKEFTPTYEAAAKELRKTGLQLAKCDATVATKLAGRVSVEEYPTALFLRAGSFEEMPAEGDTTSSDIVAWVREHAEGEAEVVDGAQLEEQLSKFKKSRTIVVGFFDSDKSSDAIAFTRATVGFTDMKVFVCTDASAASKHGASRPGVVMFRNFGSARKVVFTGSFGQPGTITDFVLENGREFTEENDVLVLGEDTYDDAVDRFGFLLVEFYAPWCGHCKKLAPEYAKAATLLRNADRPMRIAKVDSIEHRSLASSMGVSAYPTLKLVRADGAVVDFGGGRTAEGIKTWVEANAPSKFEMFMLKTKGEAAIEARALKRARGEALPPRVTRTQAAAEAPKKKKKKRRRRRRAHDEL